MKIQNRKIRVTTGILSALSIAAIMLFPMTVLPNVNAVADTLSSDCIDKATKSEWSLEKTLDTAKAKSIASSHNEFSTRTAGKIASFGSIFNTWTIDKTTCNPSWDTVNVVYYLTDANGKNGENLVFTIDPQLTKVMGVDEYVPTSFSTTQYSTNYAGYEFAADSTHSTVVTNSYGSFSIPTVSKPSGLNCYQSGTTENCEVGIWTGLTDNYGGSNSYLVQTGATAIRDCDSSGNNCTSPDYIWYEAIGQGSGATQCGSASGGDSITAQVTQDSFTSSTYHISTTDANNSHSCSATITSYGMTSPRVANFIDERPTHVADNKLDPLPSWTTNSITGDLTYGGVSHVIYTPYSSGYYQNDRMTTDGTSGTHELITEGSVGSTGSFTWTYHFST
jgi:hypothetical protein